MQEITQHDLYENYQKPWEEEWLAHVDSNLYPVDPAYRRQFQNIQRWIDNPKTLLDLGCGVGIFSINQARRFPQLRITALDLSLPQLMTARRLADTHNVGDRIQLVNASVEDLPLRSLKPDYIVMTEVLEHLLEPGKALQQIRSQCSSETRVILSVPQIYGDGGAGIFYRQVDAEGNVLVHTQDPSHLLPEFEVYKYYHAEFGTSDIQKLMRENGFVVERLQPIIFKAPIWRARPNEGTVTKIRRRTFNVTVRAMHSFILGKMSDSFDRVASRIAEGRYAQSLLLMCRTAR